MSAVRIASAFSIVRVSLLLIERSRSVVGCVPVHFSEFPYTCLRIDWPLTILGPAIPHATRFVQRTRGRLRWSRPSGTASEVGTARGRATNSRDLRSRHPIGWLVMFCVSRSKARVQCDIRERSHNLSTRPKNPAAPSGSTNSGALAITRRCDSGSRLVTRSGPYWPIQIGADTCFGLQHVCPAEGPSPSSDGDIVGLPASRTRVKRAIHLPLSRVGVVARSLQGIAAGLSKEDIVRRAIRTVLMIGLAFAWRAHPAAGQYSWSTFSASLGYGTGGSGFSVGVSYAAADPWFDYQYYDPCWDYPFYDGYSYPCYFDYAPYRPYRRYAQISIGYMPRYYWPSYWPYGYGFGYGYYSPSYGYFPPSYGFHTSYSYGYGFSGFYRHVHYGYPTYGVVGHSPRVRYAAVPTTSLYRSSPLYRSAPGYKESPTSTTARRVAMRRGTGSGAATTPSGVGRSALGRRSGTAGPTATARSRATITPQRRAQTAVGRQSTARARPSDAARSRSATQARATGRTTPMTRNDVAQRTTRPTRRATPSASRLGGTSSATTARSRASSAQPSRSTTRFGQRARTVPATRPSQRTPSSRVTRAGLGARSAPATRSNRPTATRRAPTRSLSRASVARPSTSRAPSSRARAGMTRSSAGRPPAARRAPSRASAARPSVSRAPASRAPARARSGARPRAPRRPGG